MADGDIELLFPGWNPEQPLPEPWVNVVWQDPPILESSNQAYQIAPPLQIDGVWTVQWNILNYSPEEIAKNKTRLIEMQQKLKPQENN